MDFVIRVSSWYTMRPAPCLMMADLGISHLAVRKAYGEAAGVSPYKGAFLHKPVHDRLFRFIYGISFLFFVEAVSVKNH